LPKSTSTRCHQQAANLLVFATRTQTKAKPQNSQLRFVLAHLIVKVPNH